MATIDSSYRSQVSALGTTTFSVTPARSPLQNFSFSLAFLSFMLASATSSYPLMFAYTLLMNLPFFGPIIAYALSAAFYFGIWIGSYKLVKGFFLRLQTKSRHAYAAELLVNHEGIKSADGKLALPGASIHRLVMKNAFDQSVELPATGMVVAGSATMVGAAVAANAMTNAAVMVANAKRRAVARISYVVTAEAGGVSHVLAGGLTEVCARGLMTDIERALQA